MKLFMLEKEAWRYDVLFMNGTVVSQPKPFDEQGMNVTVDTVATLIPFI